MGLNQVSPGRQPPDDFNVVIEISMGSDPVKYEVDKASGALFVDRFMPTGMSYPCNYGYIPGTLSHDGDAVDVLVVAPFPVIPGAVVRCRAIGVLEMVDEAGGDKKVLAVPVSEVCALYDAWTGIGDAPASLLAQIKHFFTHYKDLEEGKWAKVGEWQGLAEAKLEIMDGVAACAAKI